MTAVVTLDTTTASVTAATLRRVVDAMKVLLGVDAGGAKMVAIVTLSMDNLLQG
jgi:hypothetical protein